MINRSGDQALSRKKIRSDVTTFAIFRPTRISFSPLSPGESRLRDEPDKLEKVAALHTRRENARAQAQQATLNRNLQLDVLFEWFSDYMVFVRIVLKDIPELPAGVVKGHNGKIFVPNNKMGEPGTFRDPPPDLFG